MYKKIVGSRFRVSQLIFAPQPRKGRRNCVKSSFSAPAGQIRDFAKFPNRNQIELWGYSAGTTDVLRVLASPKVYKKIVGSRFWISQLNFSKKTWKKCSKSRKSSFSSPSAPQPGPAVQIRNFDIFSDPNQIELWCWSDTMTDLLSVLDTLKRY